MYHSFWTFHKTKRKQFWCGGNLWGHLRSTILCNLFCGFNVFFCVEKKRTYFVSGLYFLKHRASRCGCMNEKVPIKLVGKTGNLAGQSGNLFFVAKFGNYLASFGWFLKWQLTNESFQAAWKLWYQRKHKIWPIDKSVHQTCLSYALG